MSKGSVSGGFGTALRDGFVAGLFETHCSYQSTSNKTLKWYHTVHDSSLHEITLSIGIYPLSTEYNNIVFTGQHAL